MGKIRVLIVDDAVVIRKILTDVLSEDPGIEIVGVAANGKIAVQKITQCNPDIVTLDVEMPELNGLETVRKIRETHPKLPIVMFSTLTERGAETTLEALNAGANDYVTKPANVGSVSVAKEMVKRELLSRIHALTSKELPTATFRPRASPVTLATPLGSSPLRPLGGAGAGAAIGILAIGVSTGGPNALAALLPQLPAEFPVPIVIVQHMPPLFTKLLAQRLDSQCRLRVHEASAGMAVERGHIYLAPGNYHMELSAELGLSLVVHQGPHENSCRPAVDPLFRSVVKVFGSKTLGVILTGMGQDGLRGCEGIREAGGQVLAQDQASSVVWGMPGYVAQAGLADAVVPLSEMSKEILRRVSQTQRPEVRAPVE